MLWEILLSPHHSGHEQWPLCSMSCHASYLLPSPLPFFIIPRVALATPFLMGEEIFPRQSISFCIGDTLSLRTLPTIIGFSQIKTVPSSTGCQLRCHNLCKVRHIARYSCRAFPVWKCWDAMMYTCLYFLKCHFLRVHKAHYRKYYREVNRWQTILNYTICYKHLDEH